MGGDLLHVVYAVRIVVALTKLDATVVGSMYSFDVSVATRGNPLKTRDRAPSMRKVSDCRRFRCLRAAPGSLEL